MIVTLTAQAGPDHPYAGPATDLGFLLHKHPDRVHTTTVAGGTAHVVYPVATPTECSVALLLEVDPVALARGGRGVPEAFTLGQYVNDRPYSASSLLAVALGAVFRTAMGARCATRPDLLDVRWPLTVHVPAMPARGGADLVRRLFEPLGWDVDARPVPLDVTVPTWGDSSFVEAHLRGELTVAQALTHLYVLLPVLDDAKHYWVGPDEVDKLLRAGAGWLGGHPEQGLISHRYLAHRRALVASAVARLAEVDDAPAEALDNAVPPEDATGGPTGGGAGDAVGDASEAPARVPLVRLRHEAVLAAVASSRARRVVDWGCGSGVLIARLLDLPDVTEVVGVDVSPRALELAARRLHLDRPPVGTTAERRHARVSLLQSSLTYADARLTGYDAAVLMEVVEHLDAERLPALEHAVLGAARPATVVLTTPNAEYNVRYEGLAPGAFRHADHRFEWTRAQFAAWTRRLGERYGYAVELRGVGDDHPDLGTPTQLALLVREGDR